MLWQCLLFPWSTEGEQAKTEEEFPFSYGSCTHTVLLWLPSVEWIILIDFASLLCLYTVNSLLLQCVSSDIELKFRCGVLQFGSLSFITWNPSTLHFHEKTKQDNNNNNNNNNNKKLKWRMIIAVIYTTFTVGRRKPEKKSGLYGIRTLDLCDTGAALYQLNSAVRIIWFSYIRNFIKKAKSVIEWQNNYWTRLSQNITILLNLVQ